MKYLNLNKRKITLLSIGTVCFIIFLLMTIPASLGWQYVPVQVKKQIQLSGLQGSIWNGTAAASYINGQDTGQLNWQVSPFAFFVGKLGITFKLVGKSGSISGDLMMNETSISASNIKSNMRASFFNVFLAKQLPLPVMLQGKINAELDSLYFERGKQIQLAGSILWHNAELHGVQTIQLGKVTINVDETESGSNIKVTNKDNPLEIKGNITLNNNGHYDINIGLLNRDKSRKDLNDMLNFLGQADSSGRRYFKQKGVLRI